MIQHDILIVRANGIRVWVTGIWQRKIEDARREAVRLMGGEAVGSKSFISRHDGWELFLERGSK